MDEMKLVKEYEKPNSCGDLQKSEKVLIEVAPPSPLRKLLKERQEAVWAGV